ncbi:uncharacterized protein LOC125579991 [Brassica napus]|uniref:uncharacterized protein LOC125579991 n=1 Tax=Brassica napus TaxID=3708 RepID=UPI002078F7DF|nr:uncharacterized protein LOC125579991 [Brassica napus]
MEDIYRASSANEEWNSVYVSQKAPPVINPKPITWEPPPMGWLKCNFDCSFRKESNSVGIGWIIRDANGVFVYAGMARVNNVLNAFQGEALAFLYAMHQVWIRGWRQVWFEGDSMELTCVVNQVVPRHAQLGNVLHDIRHWMSLLSECSLGSVNRERIWKNTRMSYVI